MPRTTLLVAMILCVCSQSASAQAPDQKVPTDRDVLGRLDQVERPNIWVPFKDEILIVKEPLGNGCWNCTVYAKETIQLWGMDLGPVNTVKVVKISPGS